MPGIAVTSMRLADAFEPGLRRREFRFERQVDEVAGDGDVVGRLRLHVGHQRVQHLAPIIFAAVAGPVQVAEGALSRELGQPRLGQRRQMRVRQMRELEGGHAAFYWQAGPVGARSNTMSEALGKLRRKLEPLLRRIFHFYWRFARGMTLGVRAVVLDDT